MSVKRSVPVGSNVLSLTGFTFSPNCANARHFRAFKPPFTHYWKLRLNKKRILFGRSTKKVHTRETTDDHDPRRAGQYTYMRCNV